MDGPSSFRSLRSLLDGEMEHSAVLRQEVDTLKKKVAEQEERHIMKIQAWQGRRAETLGVGLGGLLKLKDTFTNTV